MTTVNNEKLLAAAKDALNLLTRLSLAYGHVLPTEMADDLDTVTDDLSEAIEEAE